MQLDRRQFLNGFSGLLGASYLSSCVRNVSLPESDNVARITRTIEDYVNRAKVGVTKIRKHRYLTVRETKSDNGTVLEKYVEVFSNTDKGNMDEHLFLRFDANTEVITGHCDIFKKAPIGIEDHLWKLSKGALSPFSYGYNGVEITDSAEIKRLFEQSAGYILNHLPSQN